MKQLFECPGLRGALWLRAVPLGLALVLSGMFFSGYLSAEDPQALFLGDLYNLYFPQFVEGYHLARAGNWFGVDFLTGNGASAYYLRPNIPAYYPPYLLVYRLFELTTPSAFAKAFVGVIALQATLSIYAIVRLCERFLRLELAYGLLLAVSYTFAVAHSVYLIPFYFAATLFPVLLCAALGAANARGWVAGLLYSFAYLAAFLSGYLPLAVHAVAISLLAAAFIQWGLRTKGVEFTAGRLLRLGVPALLGAVVALPLYLTILKYHALVPGVPDVVWLAAHDISYRVTDLLSLLSRGFRPPAKAEMPNVVIGLLPLFALAAAYGLWQRLRLEGRVIALVGFSLGLFGMHLLLVTGTATGLPDLFYYLVPALGSMHVYGRYLIVASFFVFLASTLLMRAVVEVRDELPVNRWLGWLLMVIVALVFYSRYWPSSLVDADVLAVELSLICVVLVLARLRQRRYMILMMAMTLFVVQSGNFNVKFNSYWLGNPAPFHDAVEQSAVRRAMLVDYMERHAPGKALIKYADLTSAISKFKGVSLNYPWLAQDRLKVSNYMGYELHLSLDKDYLARFPWFGKVDVPWLIATGADFILYDAEAWAVHAAALAPWVDREVPELDLQHGLKAARLKRGPAEAVIGFDNGIVAVSSADGSAAVSAFETNYASYVGFDVNSAAGAKVRYLLFPGKQMTFRLDGEPVEAMQPEGLAEIAVPPGQHRVEYKYVNPLHLAFIHIFRGYLLLWAVLLVWQAGRTALGFYRKSKQGGES